MRLKLGTCKIIIWLGSWPTTLINILRGPTSLPWPGGRNRPSTEENWGGRDRQKTGPETNPSTERTNTLTLYCERKLCYAVLVLANSDKKAPPSTPQTRSIIPFVLPRSSPLGPSGVLRTQRRGSKGLTVGQNRHRRSLPLGVSSRAGKSCRERLLTHQRDSTSD